MKDLLTGDGLKKELEASRKVIETLRAKSTTQDSITFNLKSQLSNLNMIIVNKDDQFKIQQQLSKDLQTALKREKFKNKLLSIGAPLLVVGAFLLK